jgi:hypothetical protein
MRIGLDSWIIQDGNYADFSVGEERSFALEFSAGPISICPARIAACARRENCVYEITAQIAFKKEEGKRTLTIIDFGLRAYSEKKLDAREGDWITGQFYIGIDPFMYFESWERRPDVPKIRSNWRIDRILLETTPRIEPKPKYFVRDATRFSEIEVMQTNAWSDDSGNASYALECTEIKDD